MGVPTARATGSGVRARASPRIIRPMRAFQLSRACTIMPSQAETVVVRPKLGTERGVEVVGGIPVPE